MDKFNDSSPPRGQFAQAGDRAAAIARLLARLRDCLEDLDRLELWSPAAHVSHGIALLQEELNRLERGPAPGGHR
ncbi:MAG: hypothetical protein ACK4K7_10330 [Allosphingosinicella sp.]|uniref:hypothetical protein n=1 Tax=Allosphingosinicella sp. TaxID=2823234 RepID=UPI0039456061